ncbi:protein DEK [Nematostella vectensis]|nr:protein DEK [Nematostella vectensis]
MASEEKTDSKIAEEKPENNEKAQAEINNAGPTDAKTDKNKEKNAKEEGNSDESSDDEEALGIFDKPVVVEGKRERKKTVFLVKDENEIKKEPVQMIFKGKGDRLGDMEVVVHELNKCTAMELKPLHKLLFGREGKQSEIKKNIRNFNGFDIAKDTKEYENKKWGIERFTNDGLKRLLEILDLPKKGKREELKERVMEFLMKPKASGRKAPEPNQPSKKSKTQKSDKGKKRKRTPKKPKEGKDDSEEEEDDNDDDDGDIEGDEEADEPPKKKKKAESKPKSAEKSKSSKSKTPAKKETKKESKKSPKKSKPVTVKITSGKKTPKKSPKKAHKTVDDLSSDEEPLVKKLKKQPPTNDDLVTVVKDLLKDADLKVVTVKSICKEVYAKYPEFDLSDRKGFIKETVYSVISSDSDQ